MLGSKELGTNVLEFHFVILANHDQNILVVFRRAQSMCFYVVWNRVTTGFTV